MVRFAALRFRVPSLALRLGRSGAKRPYEIGPVRVRMSDDSFRRKLLANLASRRLQ